MKFSNENRKFYSCSTAVSMADGRVVAGGGDGGAEGGKGRGGGRVMFGLTCGEMMMICLCGANRNKMQL